MDGETVYVRTEKGTLLALEALPEQKLKVRAGRVRWQVPGCSQLLMKGRRGIYLLGSNQEILRVNESTGEISGRFPDARLSNLSDGLLYTVRPGGKIACFEDAD